MKRHSQMSLAISVSLKNWQIGNFDNRREISKYSGTGPGRSCGTILKAGKYGLIIDSNAEDMSDAMRERIASLPAGVCVYETPFFIGTRYVQENVVLFI